MDIDLTGRVDNLRLPPSRCLMPLFEAIVNSIHAIHARDDGRGLITIQVHRDQSQGLLDAEAKTTLLPVTDLYVTDNGIGFDSTHFASFLTSDTRQKAQIGGKGIGRLLWLKAFSKIDIDSVYCGEEGNRHRRTFTFTYSRDGVTDLTDTAADDLPQCTTVKLKDMKPEYRAKCPKALEAIADRIIEHCIEFLVLGNCPRIRIEDATTGNTLDLNTRFGESMTSNKDCFAVGSHSFSINHVQRPPATSDKHSLYFCANQRVVTKSPLTGVVPNLEKALATDDGSSFIYSAYISSPLLDERARPERCDFDFPDEELRTADDVSWHAVEKAAVAKATEYLEPYTAVIRERKEHQIREYVFRKAPQFRPLLKHKPEIVDDVPPNLSEDKLDLELYRLNNEYDQHLRARYLEMLKIGEDGLDGFANVKDVYSKFLEEWNDRGHAKLAQHIVHRAATLSFLKGRLRANDQKQYHPEEAIHEVVFPLRATSDDVPSERMNLWIIDEKLSYHYYLASDMTFSAADPVDVPSRKRADILIFNNAFAFAEEPAPRFGSIVLLEFKRPVRDDYEIDNRKSNPIDQVIEYIEALRLGQAKDRNGRLIKLPASMPIHAIIVCDFSESFERVAKLRGLRPTADEQSFYLFHDNLHAFIEAMSFDAMIEKAERRNRILFDKLGVKIIEEWVCGERPDADVADGVGVAPANDP